MSIIFKDTDDLTLSKLFLNLRVHITNMGESEKNQGKIIPIFIEWNKLRQIEKRLKDIFKC